MNKIKEYYSKIKMNEDLENKILDKTVYQKSKNYFKPILASFFILISLLLIIFNNKKITYYYTVNHKSNYSYTSNSNDWTWPTEQPFVVIAGFKKRWGVEHKGIDIGGIEFASPVYAAYDGVVIKPDTLSSLEDKYGKVVVIKHSNGYFTLYGGLSDVLVKPNDIVKSGEKIGTIGKNKEIEFTSLHFSIYNDSSLSDETAIDPFKIFSIK